ncbi:MAG: hypothetical protein LUH58_09655, partial [Lachnospiraceae bacterium]|nr:hypothetical protein [Lachnospiraceae bacterium]
MKKDAEKKGEPKEVRMPTDDEMNELSKARKAFSTLGFGLFSIVVIATLAQLICGLVFRKWTSTWW